MQILALLFIIVAALLGIFLLTYVFQKKETPKGTAFTHGLLAALGLVLLIIYAFFHPSWLIILSVAFFAAAALGGITLIGLDLSGKKPPLWLALGHGLIASIGLLFLLLDLYNRVQ